MVSQITNQIGRGQNTSAITALVCGPSDQSVALAASMAIATATNSPMSRGVESTFAGDRGFGVHRWTGWTAPPTGDPTSRASAPVLLPVDPRYGFGGGPSSPPAYPSTGHESNYGSLAAMDIGKMTGLGMGG